MAKSKYERFKHLLTVILNFIAVKKLLDETLIKVHVVTGQWDLISATPGTVEWVDSLNLPKDNDKFVDIDSSNEHRGYMKNLGRLALYVLRRCGRAVPIENAEAMYWILLQITY